MAEINSKEALTAIRGVKVSLTTIIERNERLERALDSACRYLAEAQKYVGDGAYIYSHSGPNNTKCRDQIGKNIAELRAVIDA